jgi:mgtE-like transporter
MEFRDILRQSLPLLILCGIGEIFAGGVLGGVAEVLDLLPGLIVLIPAIMGLKGNIDITLGSRLGSAAHIGVISSNDIWNKETKENVYASLVLGVIMAVVAGIFAYITCILFGLPCLEIYELVGIAVISGTLAGTILAFFTVGVIIIAFRRGYDPDNITAPLLATVGDIITIGCIFLTALLFIEVI